MTTLVIAPHADDEVLGMGATIARLSASGQRVVVAILTGHGEEAHPLWPPSYWEQIRGEAQLAAKIMGVRDLEFRELPAACLDVTPAWQINSVIDELVQEVQPSDLYVPFASDLHKDHGAIAYGATVSARPFLERRRFVRRLIAYETLSETHLAPPYITPAFHPNLFIDVSETIDIKLQAMRAYASQLMQDYHPRSISTLQALATLRGAHIGVAAAEAFVLLGEYQR